jgi:hypothetical protein
MEAAAARAGHQDREPDQDRAVIREIASRPLIITRTKAQQTENKLKAVSC